MSNLNNLEYDHILIRVGEIFLKGKNRNRFESKLVSNIRKICGLEVTKKRFRLITPYFEGHQCLKKVFGITSYSLSIKVDKNIEDIKTKSLMILQGKTGKFKVNTKRSDKSFLLKSPEINSIIGKEIEEKTNLEVDYKNPDIILNIELNQDGAFLFFETIPCFGGLPVGVEGNVLLLIENEASLLAGIMFMKRGCNIFPFAFENKNIDLLNKYSSQKLNLRVVNNIKDIETFSEEKKIDVLISGNNFSNYNKLNTNLMIFRPLIAYSDQEIIEKLKSY